MRLQCSPPVDAPAVSGGAGGGEVSAAAQGLHGGARGREAGAGGGGGDEDSDDMVVDALLLTAEQAALSVARAQRDSPSEGQGQDSALRLLGGEGDALLGFTLAGVFVDDF